VNQGGGVFSAQSSASGLAALNAAAQVRMGIVISENPFNDLVVWTLLRHVLQVQYLPIAVTEYQM
jgi:hypothetical protein